MRLAQGHNVVTLVGLGLYSVIVALTLDCCFVVVFVCFVLLLFLLLFFFSTKAYAMNEMSLLSTQNTRY